jgi:delta1-piperideine-2-carboxylate reductase
MKAETAEVVHLGFAELVELLEAIFTRHGAPRELATMLATNCATAERDGAHSHGVFRMSFYVSTLRSGYVDLHATPVVEDVSPSLIRVDARNGFAQPALAAAAASAVAKARATGICLLAIRASHHLGALWIDTEAFARQGLVAIALVNGISRVAPFGGHKPFYGTNPMSFAAPRQGTDPIVFDQASSAMAFGDVKLAQLEGREVPPGTGIDRNRNPTTDAAAILEGGALLPFGGHKGSSISMMVELMAGALTGGAFSFEVDRSAYPGAQTSKSGQCLILIDPSKGAAGDYAARVEALMQGLKAAGQERLPGERRYSNRREAQRRGIPIAKKTLAELHALRDGAP